MELLHGDCLELMKDMPNKSVDVSFTSPPFNSIRHKKYNNFLDNNKNYYMFLENFTNQLLRLTKKYVIINIQSNYYNKRDVYKFIGNYCDFIKRIIIWNKNNPTPANANHLTNSYEFFVILSDTEEVRINSVSMKDIITFPINTQHYGDHKAIMNKSVSDLFIYEFTSPNDVVLDCFMGTGTTGVSCKELNRDFIGIEVNEHYYNIACDRINNTTMRKKKLF